MRAPVAASNAGARRWSGSATCGPLNVSRLTVTPSNWPVLADVDADALADGDPAVGGLAVTGAALGVAEVPQAVTTSASTTAGARRSMSRTLLIPLPPCGSTANRHGQRQRRRVPPPVRLGP